ncbi:SLC13 family permease [Candidatus Eisenbacteria bacterium]|uniref:SLC13 family permease n=1 Tax=Eiseniibacteriota bacterium TaxID=2212470 RepID=A0ABV6YNN4_UNCEI
MPKIKTPFFILAIVVTVFILVSPPPEGLSQEGQAAISVFAMCFILWTTGALPLSVTSLLAIALLPLFGALDATTAFSLFGNRAVFFILGAFMLAAAMMSSGLSVRVSLLFLKRFEGSPKRLLSGIILSCAFMAMWMPAHAVAALMFPIVLEIALALNLEPRFSNYGKALFLSMAWGCVIGGVLTLLGGARNPLAIALLREQYGLTISFTKWIVAVFPISAVLLVVVHLLVFKVFAPEIDNVKPARELIERKVRDLGPMSGRETKVLFVMITTILAWIFLGERVGLAPIAILGSSTLFVLGAMSWNDVEKYVNWGVILMYGGAIALAAALQMTGAAKWMVTSLLGSVPLDPFTLIAFVAVVSMILTEAMSNAAVVALVLPIAFELGDTVPGINPLVMVFAVALPAGLAFSLPIGTPPNAIAYSARYHRLRDSLRVGVIMNLTALTTFLLVAKYYWKWIGVY